jgi:hypothetical protein
MTNNLINKKVLLDHLSAVLNEYQTRRNACKSAGRLVEVEDYNIRMLPINNLLLHIHKGDFDHVAGRDNV